MASLNCPPSGDIVLLSEISHPHSATSTSTSTNIPRSTAISVGPGNTLRVVGCLIDYDPSTSLALLQHHAATLLVDTTLVEPFTGRNKSLYMSIGELEEFEGSLSDPFIIKYKDLLNNNSSKKVFTLKARVMRNVDGMDLTLYEQTVWARRKFEDERKKLGLI